ncbi:MAG: hypothetical protein WA941_23425 [Nitrososphaeraceae archaeon]
MKQLQLLLAIVPLLMLATISNVNAGGPRLDYGDDVTEEEADCWVDGYDAGFAGKYDKDKADKCKELGTETGPDQYNSAWGYACKNAGYMPDECENFKNNPIDIQDHEVLQQENSQNCWNDGYEDAKADKPFNKDRDHGCDEYYPDYTNGYNSGCIIDATQSSCDLLIRGEAGYCPWHPDIVACVDFLHNATNKQTESPYGTCAGMGDPRPQIICPQESNPEGYCLMTNNTAFCKTVGDLCDEDGFVKPEYPYCTK